MIVAGQSVASSSSNNNDLLIRQRNQHALETLDKAFADSSSDDDNNDDETTKSTALLYGAMHCKDLYGQLLARGFLPAKTTQWRTAWSVTVPRFGTSQTDGAVVTQDFASVASPGAIGIGLVILPLYLLIGGLDWTATLQNVLTSNSPLDATAEFGLYLFRHVLLYLGLAKFVVAWDDVGMNNSNGGGRTPLLFDDEER